MGVPFRLSRLTCAKQGLRSLRRAVQTNLPSSSNQQPRSTFKCRWGGPETEGRVLLQGYFAALQVANNQEPQKRGLTTGPKRDSFSSRPLTVRLGVQITTLVKVNS
ncbi:hypothetical protein TNCV_3895791 [Trichonephila clavipes]|nr:hypothetical protein TNCV_3895791 [Trichonephila clavipes]